MKQRTLAVAVIEQGHVRLNKVRVIKPGHGVKPGDVLTIALSARIRVLRIKDVASRRGSFAEASKLYEDLTQPSSAPEKDRA